MVRDIVAQLQSPSWNFMVLHEGTNSNFVDRADRVMGSGKGFFEPGRRLELDPVVEVNALRGSGSGTCI